MTAQPSSPRCYLDWNATSPPHAEVLSAMHRAAESCWANPASVHRSGRAAAAAIENVREELARLMACHSRDVLFTSGGTEANNLAVLSASALVVSRIEHPSIVRAAETLQARGRPVVWLPVPESGVIEPDQLQAALKTLPAGATVALMAVNHETGAVQEVARALEIAAGCGARVHVDAVQALGKLPAVAYRGAASVALAGHKIGGPKSVGALIWRGNPAEVAPLLVGGQQERGLRPGTVDPVAVAGFGAALTLAEAALPGRARLGRQRDRLEQALCPPGVVNGDPARRLPHVSNLSFPGWRGDELVAALDLLGVEVSSGSACKRRHCRAFTGCQRDARRGACPLCGAGEFWCGVERRGAVASDFLVSNACLHAVLRVHETLLEARSLI